MFNKLQKGFTLIELMVNVPAPANTQNLMVPSFSGGNITWSFQNTPDHSGFCNYTDVC